ncbi:uncharacterized protein AruCF_4941 [Achromobacter ruhlandii]|nr:uncharacterized protein AruCF_4941 [Achromobacter ruhlandii]
MGRGGQRTLHGGKCPALRGAAGIGVFPSKTHTGPIHCAWPSRGHPRDAGRSPFERQPE